MPDLLRDNHEELAIVIPAYKPEYFDLTLQSIVRQSCKKFKLYICDDNSPYNLKEIVDKYVNLINIKYVKFINNLGGRDLVAHWTRCIKQIGNEKWIWLFSDDDVMQSNCVSEFYKVKMQKENVDLFRFQLKKIDEKGNELIYKGKDKQIQTVEDLIIGRMDSSVQIAVVEFVFSAHKLKEVGGFEKFDLAWGSDDATWIKIGKDNGICNILNSNVFWRISGINISSIESNEIVYRKMIARIAFSEWLLKYSSQKKLNYNGIDIKAKIYFWLNHFLKNGLNRLNFKQSFILKYKIKKVVGKSVLSYLLGTLSVFVLKVYGDFKIVVKKSLGFKLT